MKHSFTDLNEYNFIVFNMSSNNNSLNDNGVSTDLWSEYFQFGKYENHS